MREAPGKPDNRIAIVLVILLVMLLAAVVKLAFIQAVDAGKYASKAEGQRTRTVSLPAERGSILDRNGTPLAFSVSGRAIAARPAQLTTHEQEQIVAILSSVLGSAVDGPKLLTEMAQRRNSYVYLARGLMPAQADEVMTRIRTVIDEGNVDAVTAEVQQLRNYPAGAAAKPVVGNTNTWDGKGQLGIESRFEKTLSGTPGSMVVDVYNGGTIPGSQRDVVDPMNGSDITLTLDFDLQFTVDTMLAAYVDRVGARGGMALVEDVRTGQIFAISTYQPHATEAEKLYNPAVGGPFEPGSVNKVVTFAAALDAGIITPTTTYLVEDSVKKGGATIHDAWKHKPITMTSTGILAKSSNVGTLAIAEQIGRDTFAEYLKRFGLGEKTGIELGGESAGQVLDQSLWSATSFANLPIGQGLSMTLVQLAAMYQAIANGGVRLTPTLLKSTSTGQVTTPNPVSPGVQVMKPETADTLLAMLRATTQAGTGLGDVGHRGTAPGAQLNGYQVAGKTGTAQQVDQACKCYSDALYNSTFAGVFPADNPRFVIAIMLDAPPYPHNAVPLFHDVAAYTARKFDVPYSSTPAPLYDLYVGKY